MNFDPNPLFYEMVKIYTENRLSGQRVTICNEGGSRSSKTWDFFHFLVWYCDQYRNDNQDIYILRDTLVNCRDFTMNDFKRCLLVIDIFEPNKLVTSPKPYYNLFGNNIYFRGLDDEKNTEGYPSDIIFINEALETTQTAVAGLRMRCRRLMVLDWNPKYTAHWCFDLEGQPNTFFTRTTYINNKHLEQSIINEIKGYEPTEENIRLKTANKYRWKVYGLGERCAMEGLVFQRVTWSKEITTDCNRYFWGLDFGNTTGTYALAKGAHNADGLWLDCPIYGSFAGSGDCDVDPNHGLKRFYQALKLEMAQYTTQQIIISDSAQPAKIADLNRWAEADGLKCVFIGVKKFPGCVSWRIDKINRNNLILVDRPHIRKEQENYTYRTIHGIKTNEPIDDFNHFWDASGYAVQYEESLN